MEISKELLERGLRQTHGIKGLKNPYENAEVIAELDRRAKESRMSWKELREQSERLALQVSSKESVTRTRKLKDELARGE